MQKVNLNHHGKGINDRGYIYTLDGFSAQNRGIVVLPHSLFKIPKKL